MTAQTHCTSPTQAAGSTMARAFWNDPLLLCGLAALLAVAGLLLPVFMPLGSNYWDLSLYLDAAHRIANGQTPNKDFLTPVGPLVYYLFYAVNRVFPSAHPLLSTQWSILPVALPLFAIVLQEIDKSSRAAALALSLPFLLFVALPLNTGFSIRRPVLMATASTTGIPPCCSTSSWRR